MCCTASVCCPSNTSRHCCFSTLKTCLQAKTATCVSDWNCSSQSQTINYFNGTQSSQYYAQLMKKWPTFYTVTRFIKVFTKDSRWSVLSQINSSTTSITIFVRSNLISSCHLLLGLSSFYFRIYVCVASPMNAACTVQFILLYFTILIIFLKSFFLWVSSVHCPVTSYLLGLNISLSTLFSNTLKLRSSLNVRDLHTDKKITGKIINMAVFWAVTPYSMLEIYRRFICCCLQQQERYQQHLKRR